MEQLLLYRTDYLSNGTRGVLFLPSGETVHTIENPWADNEPRVSCIPEGEYVCEPRPYYNGGYDTFHVTGVPNRSLILIHVGNTEKDVRGCIAVGLRKGTLGEYPAVLSSRDAFFDKFYPSVEDLSEFTLEVTSAKKIKPADLEEHISTETRIDI